MNFEAKEVRIPSAELLPTRASLLARLKSIASEESWSEFFNLYWKLIYNTAVRQGLSDVEAQEVVQETMIKLSKSLPKFSYDPAQGSFKGWLMTQTHCRIIEQWRRRKTFVPLACVENSLPSESFQELWDAEWKQNLINVAVEHVKARTNPKIFQVYEFCVLQEQGALRTSSMLKVSLSSVYVIVHRLNKALKKEIERILRKQ
jgi:RNA polymerase sigma factor (sigma-70 family)